MRMRSPCRGPQPVPPQAWRVNFGSGHLAASEYFLRFNAMKPSAFFESHVGTRGRSNVVELPAGLAGGRRTRTERTRAPSGRGVLWRTVLFFAATVLASRAGSPPAITVQPASQTIFYGNAVTFQVAASGTAPFYYQWFRNGIGVTSATSSALALSTVSSNDQGSGFMVTVMNDFGSVTSLVAVLTVDYGVAGPPQTNHVLSFGSVWKYDQTQNLDRVTWTAPEYR